MIKKEKGVWRYSRIELAPEAVQRVKLTEIKGENNNKYLTIVIKSVSQKPERHLIIYDHRESVIGKAEELDLPVNVFIGDKRLKSLLLNQDLNQAALVSLRKKTGIGKKIGIEAFHYNQEYVVIKDYNITRQAFFLFSVIFFSVSESAEVQTNKAYWSFRDPETNKTVKKRMILACLTDSNCFLIINITRRKRKGKIEVSDKIKEVSPLEIKLTRGSFLLKIKNKQLVFVI